MHTKENREATAKNENEEPLDEAVKRRFPERRHGEPWQLGEPFRRFPDRAYQTLQAMYPQKLSGEDVREMVRNLTGYFSLLLKWQKQNTPNPIEKEAE